MIGPDALVEDKGEAVELERLTDYSVDADGQITNKTTETVTIKAIVSNPTEEDQRLLEGRLSTGSLKLTVKSTRDVRADRDGQRDKITRDGRTYGVMKVVNDRNPLTGTQKQTVFVDEIGGR